MSTLNQVLSGLHETDTKIYENVGLNAVQKNEGVVVPILNSNQRVDRVYNSMKVASIDNENGQDQLQKIQFIGNCKVTYGLSGNLIIRIGDNLNSSTFNTNDGQTDGTALFSIDPATVSRITKATSGSENVVKKGSNDVITITTADNIHLDDNTSTTFTLSLKTADSAEAVDYVFGPITSNGYYSPNAAVSSTKPNANVILQIVGDESGTIDDEAKKSEGATGYQVIPVFTIKLSALAATEGDVQVKITTTTNGAASYPLTGMVDVCYYIVDTTTTPAVSDVKLILPAINSSTTQTWDGITSFKAGTYTYKATFADLNNPATSNEDGSLIAFDNTKNFCGDIDPVSQTTYSGEITRTGSSWINNSCVTGITSSSISASGVNINGTTTATGPVYMADGITEVTAIDVYTGSVNAVLSGKRKALDGGNWDNAANIGAGELMMYHGALQKPVTTITSSFVGCSNYKQPGSATYLSALFALDISGTEKGGKLTVSGTTVNNGLVSAVLGNTTSNLKDLRHNSGDGVIATVVSEAANKLEYTYVFKNESDELKATENHKCWVLLVYNSNTTAKITSMSKTV